MNENSFISFLETINKIKSMKGANIKTFIRQYKNKIDSLIQEIESDVETIYLTDEEWDDIYENVIDPLERALGHLESLDEGE